jgi:hypothetical protein
MKSIALEFVPIDYNTFPRLKVKESLNNTYILSLRNSGCQLAGSLAIDRKSAEQYLEQRYNVAAEFSTKRGRAFQNYDFLQLFSRKSR